MNREILFRGKRVDNGEWIYGNYVYEECSKRYYITLTLENSHKLIEVIPETIGQYTGLTDKNDNKIFEGDIFQGISCKLVVKWNKHRMGFSLYPTTEQLYDEMPVHVENKLGFEVIGNIHDGGNE